MVSNKNSAMILSLVSLYIEHLLLTAFNIFSFKQFDYDMPLSGFLFVLFFLGFIDTLGSEAYSLRNLEIFQPLFFK